MGKHMKKGGHMDVIERIYNDLPSFSDYFTEDSFYMFAVCFVIGTVMVAILLSRFVTIKPID